MLTSAVKPQPAETQRNPYYVTFASKTLKRFTQATSTSDPGCNTLQVAVAVL